MVVDTFAVLAILLAEHDGGRFHYASFEKEYPELKPEDIREALTYASALANEEVHLFKCPAA